MKRALVTGGSSGIGAAVVKLFEREGWATLDASRRNGFDVTSTAAVRAMLSEPFDAYVLCAGEANPAPLADLSWSHWESSLAVNVGHHLRVLRHLARYGPASAPVVIVASTAGTRPSPGWATYSAAKAALINLGLTAHAEMSNRVYVLAPGRCATPLRSRLAPGEDQSKIMQPDEVAEIVADCVADTAGVLAGQVIEVRRS